MNSEKSNMVSWSLNKKDYTNKSMHTNVQGSPVVVFIMLIIMVKFSLLHRNMDVTDEKQEHSLHWICVNQVILSLNFYYISWPLDITGISSPPSLGQDSEVNAIGRIAKQEETMTYNDWKYMWCIERQIELLSWNLREPHNDSNGPASCRSHSWCIITWGRIHLPNHHSCCQLRDHPWKISQTHCLCVLLLCCTSPAHNNFTYSLEPKLVYPTELKQERHRETCSTWNQQTFFFSPRMQS